MSTVFILTSPRMLAPHACSQAPPGSNILVQSLHAQRPLGKSKGKYSPIPDRLGSISRNRGCVFSYDLILSARVLLHRYRRLLLVVEHFLVLGSTFADRARIFAHLRIFLEGQTPTEAVSAVPAAPDMPARWTRPASAQALARSPTTPGPYVPVFKTRGARSTKGSSVRTLNPLRWSAAGQTFALLLCSGLMLLYIVLTPTDTPSRAVEPAYDTVGGVKRRAREVYPVAEVRIPVQPDTRSLKIDPIVRTTATDEDEDHLKTRDKWDGTAIKFDMSGTTRVSTRASTMRGSSAVVMNTKRSTAITVTPLAGGIIELLLDPSSVYYPSPSMCRLRDVCIDEGFKVVLPPAASRHTRALHVCGIADTVIDPELEKEKFQKQEFYMNMMRYHMPHLASDMLSLSYAMSVVKGSYTLSGAKPSNLLPVVVAQDKIRRLDAGSWSLQMVSQLPFSASVTTREELFHGTRPTKRVCYKSLVGFSSQAYWQVANERFSKGNVLFDGTSLWNRYRSPEPTRTADVATGGNCRLNILVLNRPHDEQRTLANLHEVQSQIENMKQNDDYKHLQETNVNVAFMNVSFREQIDTMQNADIIFAAHGAALANLMFAHVGTPVIEVLPFTYYAILFERIAQSLGLHHESIVSQPDTERFFECILKKNSDKQTGVLRNEKGITNLRRLWGTAANASSAQNDYRKFETHGEPPSEIGEVEGIRMCARNQFLRVDAQSVAKRLMHMVGSICKSRGYVIPKPNKGGTGTN